MKKVLHIVYIILLLTPYPLFATEYSLSELYKLALDRSETIKIAEEDLYISERDRDRAEADLIPTVSAFGEHIRYSKEQRSSGVLLQPDHASQWGLRLDNTYSLGGREFTALDISRQGIQQSRFDLYAVREQYLLDVAAQYYDVLRAKREIEIAEANVQRLTTERNAAKKRLEVGTAIKTALLRAEAELADAQSQLIRAENILKIAKNILANTVGISEDYDVKEPLAGADYKIPDQGIIDLSFLTGDCDKQILECLKETALRERAEIKSFTTRRDIAEDSIKLAESTYWPDFSLEGVYLREESDPSQTFELNERMYGGLRLDFPFFEGGLKKAQVSQAKSRHRQAEYGLADLKKRIRVEVENSYIVTTTAASLLAPRRAEVEFGRENYNLVSKQFQYGLADSIDVIDANTRLVTSERQLLNAQYAYVLALMQLQRDTGMLLKSVIGDQAASDSDTIKE